MASPLSQFNNARLLWQAPGGRSGPEDGYQQLPGQEWLITAFLKQTSASNRSTYKDVIDISIATDIYEGYITGSVQVPEGANWRTYEYASDSSYDVTATRPLGFEPPGTVELSMGHRYTPRGELMNTSGRYDDEGIGKIIRDVLGDRLILKVEWW